MKTVTSNKTCNKIHFFTYKKLAQRNNVIESHIGYPVHIKLLNKVIKHQRHAVWHKLLQRLKMLAHGV